MASLNQGPNPTANEPFEARDQGRDTQVDPEAQALVGRLTRRARRLGRRLWRMEHAPVRILKLMD